jgi:hypothetical protein
VHVVSVISIIFQLMHTPFAGFVFGDKLFSMYWYDASSFAGSM